MTCRWELRTFKHSSADRSVGGEPRVKLSANADSKGSVPCRGRLRSVEGRLENRCVRFGRVSVDKICMYKASS